MKPLYRRAGKAGVAIYRRFKAGKVRYQARDHNGTKIVNREFTNRQQAEFYRRERLVSKANGTTSIQRRNLHQLDYADRLIELEEENGSSIDALYFERKDYYVRKATAIDTVGIDVSDAVQQFLTAKRSLGLSPKNLADYESRLGRFTRFFQMGIGLMTSDRLGDWLNNLTATTRSEHSAPRPISPRTRNNYRAALRDFFTFAKEKKWLPPDWNELAAIKAAKTKSKKEIWTPQEMRLLLDAASDRPILPLVVLGGFAGLRTESEIVRLHWEDFDWDSRRIHIYEDVTKTGDPRLVPILDATYDFLKQWRNARGKVCTLKNWSNALARLAKAAGVGHWRTNALRHSYGTYRVAVVEDLAKVALEMGNSPGELVASYRRPRLKESGEEWFALRPRGRQNVFPFDAQVNRRQTVGWNIERLQFSKKLAGVAGLEPAT